MSDNLAVSSALNSPQSVSLKLYIGGAVMHSTGNSSVVSMGTWLVPGPLSQGSVIQLTSSDSVLAKQKTLSGRVQFLVAMASSVRMSFGSTITMS